MTGLLLQARDIAVFRGEHCLFSGLGFTVSAGEVLQLHGDNGSGKTSLIRALCTLLPLEQGTISWRGVALPASRDQYFSEMTYAGHTEAIKGDLSARENLSFVARCAVPHQISMRCWRMSDSNQEQICRADLCQPASAGALRLPGYK